VGFLLRVVVYTAYSISPDTTSLYVNDSILFLRVQGIPSLKDAMIAAVTALTRTGLVISVEDQALLKQKRDNITAKLQNAPQEVHSCVCAASRFAFSHILLWHLCS